MPNTPKHRGRSSSRGQRQRQEGYDWGERNPSERSGRGQQGFEGRGQQGFEGRGFGGRQGEGRGFGGWENEERGFRGREFDDFERGGYGRSDEEDYSGSEYGYMRGRQGSYGRQQNLGWNRGFGSEGQGFGSERGWGSRGMSERQGGSGYEGEYGGWGQTGEYGSSRFGEGPRYGDQSRFGESGYPRSSYYDQNIDYGSEQGGYTGFGPRQGSSGWQSGQRGWTGSRGGQERMMGSFAGRGPQGYRRSDERILEDINESLTQDPRIDATMITAEVKNGEVVLKGSVPDRNSKRLAEDVAESCSGVKDVQNQLRVKREDESETESRQERGDETKRSGRQSAA